MTASFVGTSGWIYKHWRGVVYPPELPQSHWFEYYAQRLSTVEINNTFYRLPEDATFDAWRRQAPKGFVYALKASRYITHLKKLKDPAEPVARFMGRAVRLGPSLGPVLYQLPPNWHLNLERLEEFLAAIPARRLQAFEFRHPSWLTEQTFALLEQYGAGYCISDMPGLDSPLRATGRLAYIRLHGPARAYAGSYSEAELAQWAERARAFMAEGRPAYVYFNNDAEGHAVHNALRLREMLEV